jgi:hypothetical protein
MNHRQENIKQLVVMSFLFSSLLSIGSAMMVAGVMCLFGCDELTFCEVILFNGGIFLLAIGGIVFLLGGVCSVVLCGVGAIVCCRL